MSALNCGAVTAAAGKDICFELRISLNNKPYRSDVRRYEYDCPRLRTNPKRVEQGRDPGWWICTPFEITRPAAVLSF
jgi:hypothetical protein